MSNLGKRGRLPKGIPTPLAKQFYKCVVVNCDQILRGDTVTSHFRKKSKPIPIETHDLPNNVRVGYKDIKIRYVRPNYKKWELTDCFGEYDYRQNVIQVQHDLVKSMN